MDSSSSTHVDHKAWLIDSGVSFHFTPHREWFCEYEKYDGGDVVLGDDRKARIIGHGKVKLELQGERIRTLLCGMHILALARNLIFVSTLDDAGVKTVFEKDTYKMVREALVLMRGVRIGTLYKLQGITFIDVCNSSVVPESGAENLVVSGEKTMLWHQRLGYIGEKGLRILHSKGMVEALEDKTPQEALTGKKHSLSHLRVSGCDAYVYVPKEKRTKLDSKYEKCIFIGYKDGLKGYKLWNQVTKKVVYNRDVVFREVKDVIKHEVLSKELEKIEFELKEEESDSTTKEESEDEEPQTSVVRRSIRERRQLERYSPYALCSNFALSITDDYPRTMKEAVDLEDEKIWKEAMVDEMASLHKNEAWDLVELPARRKPIGSKWVFKKKMNAKGKVEKYKARLVAKGYFQVSGIDFGDIFSHVAKVASIILLLSVVVAYDFEVEQMDVKTTFLHGDRKKRST
eukprot:PITA_20668